MSDHRAQQPPPREREAVLKAIADSVVGSDNALPGLGQMAAYSFVLPTNVLSLPSSVIDDCVRKALEPHGLINWCNTIKRVQPVCTRGDGNCLLHAVSLYLWGVHDSLYVLRRLVSAALIRDKGQIKKRWQHEVERESSSIPGGLHLSEEEWQRDWNMVVRLASDSDGQPPWKSVNSLEAVHVFAIANVLRRPVLVYGEAVIRDVSGYSFSPNNIVGAYLPLLSEPAECTRSPILLAFHNGHFVPLLSVDDDAQTVGALAVSGLHAAPMVLRSLEQLRLHFLLPSDEPHVFDLLHSYLNLDEAPYTQRDSVQSILFARLTLRKLPESLRLMLPQLPCEACCSAPADDDSGCSGGSSSRALDYSRIDGPSNFGYAPIGGSRLQSPAFATAAAAGAPTLTVDSHLPLQATVGAPVALMLSKQAPVPATPAPITSIQLPANTVATAAPASAVIASAPPLIEEPVQGPTASASSVASAAARTAVALPSSAAVPAADALQPVIGYGLTSGGRATSSAVDTTDRSDTVNGLPIASRGSALLNHAPVGTVVRRLSEGELAALQMTSLSGAPCVTDGCTFFSSINTYPHCHVCARASRAPAVKSGAALASGHCSPPAHSRVGIGAAAAGAGIATPVQQPMAAGATANGAPVSSAAMRVEAAAPGRAWTPASSCSSSSSSRSRGSSSSAAAGQGRHRQPLKGVICSSHDCQQQVFEESYPYCPQCSQKFAPPMAGTVAAVSGEPRAAVHSRAAGSANGPDRLAGIATGSTVLPASGDCGQQRLPQQPMQPHAGVDGRGRPAPAHAAPAAVVVARPALGLSPDLTGLRSQAPGGRPEAGSQGPSGSAKNARSSWDASSSSSRAGIHWGSTAGGEQLKPQLAPACSDASAEVTDAKSRDVTELPIRDVSNLVSPTDETRAARESVDKLVRMPPPLISKMAPLSGEGVASGNGAYHEPVAAVACPGSGAAAGGSDCVHPECANHGLPMYGGLCKECYDVICAFKQKQRQKKTTVDVPRCSYQNCERIGHADLGGLCQNHYRP